MKYGQDRSLFGIVLEKYGVRKTSDERATIVLMNYRIYARVSFDGQDSDFQAPDKIHAKSWGLAFVP